MNTRLLGAAGALGMSLAGSARAEIVVGSFELSDEAGIAVEVDTMSVSFGMLKDFAPFPENLIFFEEDLEIGAPDVGSTWASDAATMDLIRDQLQDADTFDSLGVEVMFDLPNGDVFSYFLGVLEFEFPTHGLDLATIAAQTDEIRVTLLSFATDSPGMDPNGDGAWTDYSVSYRFDFVSIPAPGASAALLAGLAPVRRRRATS